MHPQNNSAKDCAITPPPPLPPCSLHLSTTKQSHFILAICASEAEFSVVRREAVSHRVAHIWSCLVIVYRN